VCFRFVSDFVTLSTYIGEFMSAQLQAPSLSFDELLAAENASPIRHEYIGGQLYAMAGGTPNHADICVNLSTAIHSRLRGKPCRGSSSDQRVRTSETATNWYYPDFLIKCPPIAVSSARQKCTVNPRAIFEVLSPETEHFDRTGKFDDYKTIEELTDYVLLILSERASSISPNSKAAIGRSAFTRC
jgi:Uma2 family endonuclease